MSTTPILTDNKAALRASLKKEDESLATRLAESEFAPVTASQRETSVVAPEKPREATSEKLQARSAGQPPLADEAVKAKPAADLAPPSLPEKNAIATMTMSPNKSGKKTKKLIEKPVDKKAAKKAAKRAAAAAKPEKMAKAKREKVVRYQLALPKSEDAAIDALRADLSKAAGCAASKSDILRAALQLFAEQKMGPMKERLAAAAIPTKGKKKR